MTAFHPVSSKPVKALQLQAAFVLMLWLSSCSGEDKSKIGGDKDSLSWMSGMPNGPGGCRLLSGRNTVTVGDLEVEIWVPEGKVHADLLLLPGWSFSRTDWCEKTLICRKALHEGYRLIMPEMQKSIYATRYYPETRADWRAFPTSTWVADTLIPELQKKYCLLQPGAENFMMGLSTGGRGVAMITLKLPSLFKGGVALSGDFDQSLMKGDNLMRGVYGDYDSFPDRWESEDNPARRAAEINIPLYLAHGKKDQMVPWEQTDHFFKEMRKAHPNLKLELNLPEEMGHDYAFWGNEVDRALEFFSKISGSAAESMQ